MTGATQPGEAEAVQAVIEGVFAQEERADKFTPAWWQDVRTASRTVVEAAYPVIAAAVEARVRAETQAEIAVYQAQIGVSASRYVEKCEEVDLLEERIAELEARA